MPHQLVSEGHLKKFCIYCKTDVPMEKWESEFDSEGHYKTFTCSCGKKLHIKMDFEGSGHDSWNEERFSQVKMKEQKGKKTIEDKIKVIDNFGEIVSRKYPSKK